MALQDRCYRLGDVGIGVVEGDQHGMVARALEAIKRHRPKTTLGQIRHLRFELPRADKEIPLCVVTTDWRLHDRVVHQRYAGRWLDTSCRHLDTNSVARRARPCKVNRCAISRRAATSSAVLD